MPKSGPTTVLRFGVFELDLEAGELRKAGGRLRLQKQPFEILRILVQRPAEIVTREELRAEIWSADTFVDFDNSLNTSINKLRDVLGDTSSSPRFIETVPRRGYRFIAPVTSNGPREATASTPSPPPAVLAPALQEPADPLPAPKQPRRVNRIRCARDPPSDRGRGGIVLVSASERSASAERHHCPGRVCKSHG